MPRKSLDIRFTDYPISAEKGATAPFSCLPARMGSGKARIWVKGRVPCGYLGQRPKPSESLLLSISTIFKVRLSLILGLSFFINHLTLSRFLILRIILLLHQNIFRNFTNKKMDISKIIHDRSTPCIANQIRIRIFINDGYQVVFCISAVTRDDDMIFAVKFRHNLPDHGGCQFQFRLFFLPHTITKRNRKSFKIDQKILLKSTYQCFFAV